MRIIAIHILLILFTNTFSLTTIAQKGKIRRLRNDYKNFAYAKTGEELLKVASRGHKSKELFQQLANSFYFNNQMKDAAKWYGELMALNEAVDPEYYYRYALSLKGVEDYEASDIWMKKFSESKPDDLRAKAFISKKDYKTVIEQSSRKDIQLVNLEFNTPFSDFGTTEYQNTLVFASARGGGRKYKWDKQPYLDLYVVEKTTDGYDKVEAVAGKVNTRYHESSATYSADGKYMYFSRNNYYDREYNKDSEGINRLKLYRATRSEDGSWGDIYSIHFNSDDYSVSHPVISPDGKKLYFASDMPGTFGQSDIFVVDIHESGSLGEPSNLGPSINTEGRESFPFINTKGDLYFSSDGHPGLGGLDVYFAKGVDQNSTTAADRNFTIINAGRPVNSIADDFGYYESLEVSRAYFSSNRQGGKGSDDIYTFIIPECDLMIVGTVHDKDTDEQIPQAMVVLLDTEGQELMRMVADENASFKFNADCEKEYLIRAEKEGYVAEEKRFTTPKSAQEFNLKLLLDKEEQQITPCDDLAKVLNIPAVYFDFDKYNIRDDAKVELKKILSAMDEYPTMSIDIRSHTDCRGRYAYNEKLSNNRAKSTRRYLIENGIAENRLTATGYGEFRLINDCSCEPTNISDCSKAEHQLNRRSEFIITSINGKTCDEGED